MKEKAWDIYRRTGGNRSDKLLGTVRAPDRDTAEERACGFGMNGTAKRKRLYAAPLHTARFTALPESRIIGTFDFSEYVPTETFDTLRIYALSEQGVFFPLIEFALKDRDPIKNPYLPVFKIELRGADGSGRQG